MKPGVFVLDIKTILALFHLTNQPRQKLKLALTLSAKTISRRATGRATDEPTDQPSPNRLDVASGIETYLQYVSMTDGATVRGGFAD